MSLVYPYDRDNFDPPAPVLVVSLTVPYPLSGVHIVRSRALLDSGSDITVVPKWIVQDLHLRYVDEVIASGYDGVTKNTYVYSVKIIFDNLGELITRVLAEGYEYTLIGRDILNEWSLFLKGQRKIFEIN